MIVVIKSVSCKIYLFVQYISQYQCRLNKSPFPSSTLSSLLPTLATNYSKKLMNHICTISGRENIFFSLIRVSWVQQQVRHETETRVMLQLCPNEASAYLQIIL